MSARIAYTKARRINGLPVIIGKSKRQRLARERSLVLTPEKIQQLLVLVCGYEGKIPDRPARNSYLVQI